ncbi:MAG: ATPase [Rhodobacterales bacterium]|nr:MAG: ATPase [Rhodobacterales bacterium]
MTHSARPKDTALKRLRRPLRLTRLGMLCERVLRSFWPLWTVGLTTLALLMLGAQDMLPVWAARTLALILLLAGLLALIHGLRRFVWPSQGQARTRLDASLPGHPITALTDTQAIGATDDASRAVWQAHLARIAERLQGIRAVRPDLTLSGHDPYALRYLALLLFVLALTFGSVQRIASVAELARITAPDSAIAAASWEGWIEPPAYTGKPTLYLNDLPEGDLQLQKGARLTLRFYGRAGALKLHETISGQPLPVPDQTAGGTGESHALTVAQAGELRIQGKGGAQWTIRLLPDTPPNVAFAGEMIREADGLMRQPFTAGDDYAIEGGTATFTLDMDALQRRYGLAVTPEPRDPITLDLPLPPAAKRAEFSEELTGDLSKNPWSGLPVILRLQVQDAQGQTGQSPARNMPLPGRRFFVPLAAAVAEQRRDLLWSAQNAPRVAQVLRAITHRPDGFVRNESGYLMLRQAVTQLESSRETGLDPKERDQIADALWDIAELFEDGSLADAKERLHRAQERLAEAMKNGASKDEIDALMQELRDATDNYLRQLAENQDDEGKDQQQAQGDPFQFNQDELQALMDRIQELMEQGRMEEAQELMERMNELMENLRVTQGGQGGGPGGKSMRDLKDTLRDQQDLSDEAFRDLQKRFDPEGGEGQNAEPGEQGLADRQQALRDQLRRQQQALPGARGEQGDEARRSLDQAGRAMERAEQALRDEDLPGALDKQAEALEALRDGVRQLGNDMADNQSGQQPGENGQAMGQDPLGRTAGRGRNAGTQDELLKGQDVYRRARELLKELRRRSGNQQRPQVELDYLKRLLDRF